MKSRYHNTLFQIFVDPKKVDKVLSEINNNLHRIQRSYFKLSGEHVKLKPAYKLKYNVLAVPVPNRCIVNKLSQAMSLFGFECVLPLWV